ncbi:sensor histidine kinase [Pseudoalteromonas denitrificans]|uniref:histidine kinase n=1 Tax=Pseudoalteromonas denitrificans DSM 6059 TaxID=1123010 RepID=A0A1I1Q5Y7_9GAMM|nr:ATP-binding protein [Pseudoalteromonas denitrificans]SFD14633.1 PAS fold-containing protein [Pseudoalteromonas denitrificans DSM 6059]
MFLILFSIKPLAEPVFTDVNQPMINYTPESGLSQLTVTAIIQDDLGFMWFGTQTGLNRFDSYEFTQFKAQSLKKNQLAGNFIRAMCRIHNFLWIGTSTGLSSYNVNTGEFRSYFKDFNDVIPSDNITSLSCFKSSVLIGTEANGLWSLNITNDKATVIEETANMRISSIQQTLHHIYFGAEKGLFSLTKDEFKLTQNNQNSVQSLLLINNKLIVGLSDGGLNAYDILSNKLVLSWSNVLSEKIKNKINALVKYKDKVLVGTMEGVYIIDLTGNIVDRYKHNASQSYSLSDDIVLSLFVDKEESIWVGSNSGGINYLTQKAKRLGHINQYNYQDSPIEHADMRSFALDNQGRMWFATSKGISIFDHGKFIKAESLFEQLKPLKSAFITGLLIVEDGIWLTSRGAGITYFNFKSKKVEFYSPANKNSPSLSCNAIIEYQNSIIVSSRDYGLLRFDKQKNVFLPFISHFTPLPKNITGLLVVNNELWFGSIGYGLFRYYDGKLEQLTVKNGLLSNIIFSLALDNKGRVWGASDFGVNVLNSDFQLVHMINQKGGLKNESIWSVVFDEVDSVWLGTSGGLVKVNVNNYAIENFNVMDGSQSSEFNFGAAWLSPSGRVFMGGTNGFNQFKPEHIVAGKNIPQLRLSKISILGKTITPQNSPKAILYQPEIIKKITLEHEQDIMSFKYVSLAYSNHKEITYYYKVIGLSEQWLPMEEGSRQVNLIKPAPGDYQLEAYAVDQNGDKSKIHVLNIELLAPWWWSQFSKLLYSILFISTLVLVFVYRYRVYQNVIKDNLAMSELKQRLELSLWASGDELWDWDVINNKIYRYAVESRIDYGKEVNHKNSKYMAEFVHLFDRPLLLEKIRLCLEEGINSYEVSVRIKDFFGNWCWVLDRGKVVHRNEYGNVTRMSGSIRDIAELKLHEDSLQELNEKLEHKVAARTAEISKKNDDLEHAVSQLKLAQNELIESEKMASLGNLVAGISHEINTPLGIAITAITHNQDYLVEVQKKLDNKTLTQSDLIESISSQMESYRLILKNLDRANHLIANFKQIAVDQNSETQREVNLTEYITEVMNSVKPLFTNKNISVVIHGPELLKITTYPGPIYQIITNLVNNSVIHGFEGLDKGILRIEISILEGKICMNYFDNGIGMEIYMLQHIFDPFVTSKRNQGGSGLGMNIVYNLVSQILKGEIKCFSSPGSGLEVQMRFPINIC